MSFVEFTEVHSEYPLKAHCRFPDCRTKIMEIPSQNCVSVIEGPQMLLPGKEFIVVADAFDFDNITVSKPTGIGTARIFRSTNSEDLENSDNLVNSEIVNPTRYLFCGECEKGPIGFATDDARFPFLLHRLSVSYAT